MSENKMSEIIKASLEGIKDFASSGLAVGDAVETPSGVTVIPVSKITVGFATGGVDYGVKKLLSDKGFGGGGGTGISVTPLAFLTVQKSGEVGIIRVGKEDCGLERVISLIEHSPELIEKIKGAL